jgi:hypothetical protein
MIRLRHTSITFALDSYRVGRTKGMSDQQREAWSYTKNQISEARKAALQNAAQAEKEFLQKARADATAKAQEISAKLKEVIDSLLNRDSGEQQRHRNKLAAEQKAKSDQIREKADQQISALPPIPDGVSAGVRARLTAQRQIQINRIRGDAASQLAAGGCGNRGQESEDLG